MFGIFTESWEGVVDSVILASRVTKSVKQKKSFAHKLFYFNLQWCTITRNSIGNRGRRGTPIINSLGKKVEKFSGLTPPQEEMRKRHTSGRTTPTRSSPPATRRHMAALLAGWFLQQTAIRRVPLAAGFSGGTPPRRWPPLVAPSS